MEEVENADDCRDVACVLLPVGANKSHPGNSCLPGVALHLVDWRCGRAEVMFSYSSESHRCGRMGQDEANMGAFDRSSLT